MEALQMLQLAEFLPSQGASGDLSAVGRWGKRKENFDH